MYLLHVRCIPSRALGTEDSMGIKFQSVPSCLEIWKANLKFYYIFVGNKKLLKVFVETDE